MDGQIKSKIKGGYRINVMGYDAFCPNSEMYPNPNLVLDRTILGKTMKYRIIKVELNSVIVSRKKAAEDETLDKVKQALVNGKSISGVVKKIEVYGAFIDLGGLDGLLHISEIADHWIENIQEHLKVGQIIEVKIISIDNENKRISLTMGK